MTAVPPGPPACSHWDGPTRTYCGAGDGSRRFQRGWRCGRHTPAALAGEDELPTGPGWPSLREGR